MKHSPLGARAGSAARTSPSATPAAKPAALAPVAVANDTRRNRAQRRSLRLRKLAGAVATIALTPAARAAFDAQLSADDAATAGRRYSSADVLADLLDGLSPAVVRAIVDQRVAGFGPLALRYTLDLATELDARHAARVAHQRRRATAAAAFAAGSEAVYAQRSALVARLDDALAADAPERAALAKIATDSHDPLDVALAALDALAELADTLLDRADDDEGLRAVLDDQQFTRTAIEALLTPVDAVIDAREERRDAADLARVEQQSIDALEGRVRDQLLRARRCVERAKAAGVKVPAMALSRLRVTSSVATEKQPDAPVDPTP